MSQTTNIEDYIKWLPKQAEAYKHIGTGNWLFYGGARGGGKSHFCLGAAVLSALQFPGIRIVCIRETYPELEGVFVLNLLELYPEEVFGYTYTLGNRIAKFDNGSLIIFRACDSEMAAKKIKGLEYQLMIIDEANEFDEETVEKLTGSLRNTHIPNFIPTLLMTGNPGGKADLYFKTRYINPDYKYWTEAELKHKDRYIFISAKVYDNAYLGEDYISNLESKSEHLRRAWLHGDWNVYEGQYFEEWNADVHVIPTRDLPKGWVRKAGFDLGYTEKHPSVMLWGAQDPQTLDLYIYREYSGSGPTEKDADQMAPIIRDEPVHGVYADPSCWAERQDKYVDESPAFMMIRRGIPLISANNSRVSGWRVVKQWLHWSERKPPKMFIMDCCVGLIQTLPLLRYDKKKTVHGEDLDTTQKDDFADALRYMLVSGFQYPTATDQLDHDNAIVRQQLMEEEVDPDKIIKQFMSVGLDPPKKEHADITAPYSSFLDDTYVSTRSYYG